MCRKLSNSDKPKSMCKFSLHNFSLLLHANCLAPPKISRTFGGVFEQQKNKEGSVICLIYSSNPRPSVTWSQQDLKRVEDKPIEELWTVSEYSSKLEKILEGGYKSTLIIPRNKNQSFYRCFAENGIGNDSRVVKFLRCGKDHCNVL